MIGSPARPRLTTSADIAAMPAILRSPRLCARPSSGADATIAAIGAQETKGAPMSESVKGIRRDDERAAHHDEGSGASGSRSRN